MRGEHIKDIFELAAYGVRKRKPRVEGDLPDTGVLKQQLDQIYPPEIIDKAPEKEKVIDISQELVNPPEIEDISLACVPCALGHFATSTGLLNEAMRFKKDGIGSNEILDRIGKALEEQNALERVDLTPERIQTTKDWEGPIAEEALKQSRALRHKLESIETIGDLEQAAADTERYYKKLNREWYKGRFAHLGEEKARIVADLALRTKEVDR